MAYFIVLFVGDNTKHYQYALHVGRLVFFLEMAMLDYVRGERGHTSPASDYYPILVMNYLENQ